METNSIKVIGELKNELKSRIPGIDKKRFGDQTFGQENEYTYQGLIGGVDSLLTDISVLVKAHNKFIQISNLGERNNIATHLRNITTHLENPNQLWQHIDALKILLRSYNVRKSKERFAELDEEIETVLKNKLKLDEEILSAKSLKKGAQQILEEIEIDKVTSNTKLEEFKKLIPEFEEKIEELQSTIEQQDKVLKRITDIHDNSETLHDEIQSSYNESKSNEKIIDSFATKVQEREKTLEKISEDTKVYTNKIAEFTKERKELLKEAEDLIDSAKQALNYKTAEGISAAFEAKYQEAKDGKNWTWLLGSAACLLGTIGLGVWILVEASTNIGIILGRIALLPFPIGGAIFCANQYVKNKNITEDYAYKAVLSKSIVGFSEQILENGNKDGAEYVKYMETVLSEIHKDPLRKRTKDQSKSQDDQNLSLDKFVELAEKIVKLKGE